MLAGLGGRDGSSRTVGESANNSNLNIIEKMQQGRVVCVCVCVFKKPDLSIMRIVIRDWKMMVKWVVAVPLGKC